ncbi:ANTAR domain-containing protein [Streptomyces sp. NPDC088253]|uniref:ANTAR domain-containing protein n=1 Tax=Streptomyces sp. NPDC088253 TaxID=3365846 RepID=UPI0037F249ED
MGPERRLHGLPAPTSMRPGPAIRAICRAIGIVVTLAGLRAEDGRDVLREISQRADNKMRHVAELIVEWARTGHLASAIRHKLERGMATRATLRPEPG